TRIALTVNESGIFIDQVVSLRRLVTIRRSPVRLLVGITLTALFDTIDAAGFFDRTRFRGERGIQRPVDLHGNMPQTQDLSRVCRRITA
ncbi:MAG: hypothetical protein VX663_06635, partial [Pseudomonadota bacterium]|nr:hypothetical protein [Pseudomonadota bacterium]